MKYPRAFPPFLAPIALLALSLTLPGCEDIRHFDAEAAHPSTVEKHTAVLTVQEVKKGRISLQDSQNIDEFVHAYQQQGEAPIAVSIGGVKSDDPQVVNQVAILSSELTKRGVARKDIAFFLATDKMPSFVRLAFPFYSVAPEECGSWTRSSEFDLDNHISANFGCATQHNIDVMAANPADLYHPRPSMGRSANRSFDVVSAYWAGDAIPSAKDLPNVTVTDVKQ